MVGEGLSGTGSRLLDEAAQGTVCRMRKPEITVEVVSCLVREQFPGLARERVVPVDVDGWDNSSFRVGAERLARLPTDDGYVPAVAKEHRRHRAQLARRVVGRPRGQPADRISGVRLVGVAPLCRPGRRCPIR